MSEEPQQIIQEDIFKYDPITEWNNLVIEFGMPSTDGNLRLTEICLAAESCLEASNNATQLSFTDIAFEPARSSPVQKIIRTLFGEETGITIETYAAVEAGVAYFMSPPVSVDIAILEKHWAVEVINQKMDIGFQPVYKDIWTDPYEEKLVTNATWHRRWTVNPLAVGQVVRGNRPISGNWDTDGEPYWEISWEAIDFGRCSYGGANDQLSCESTQIPGGGFCRQADIDQPRVASGQYTATCTDPQYTTRTTCMNSTISFCSDPQWVTQNDCESQIPPETWSTVNAGNVWQVHHVVYNDVEELIPITESVCEGIYGGGTWWSSQNYSGGDLIPGKCYYTHPSWSYQWYIHAQIETKEECMVTASTWTNWDPYYRMWIEQTNAWTQEYAKWRPSQSTMNYHKHYNILTHDNHRKWPGVHVTDIHNMMGTTHRMYYYDVGGSWGNGPEVGRSSIATWVTNTFDWPDNDHTFDYCYDSGWNPIPEWSPPAYNDQGAACEASGTCSDATFDNREADCTAPHHCSDGSGMNESDCVNHHHCSNSAFSDSSSCTNAGICTITICFGSWGCHTFPASNYSGNPSGCAAIGGSYSYHGYTWNNSGYTWDQTHTWTDDNYQWSTQVPYIEVDVPPDPDYFWNISFPAHTFVNTNDSMVGAEFGYSNVSSGQQPNFSKIRWKPPQYNSDEWNKTYFRPDKFRIYRAPYFSPLNLQLTDSDYEAEMWKLAGEVICTDDSAYHYFYDSREDMMNENLGPFQGAYYAITAVWEDWNYKRGWKLDRFDGLSGVSWDPRYNQSWSSYVTLTHPQGSQYGTYRVNGACSSYNTTYMDQASCEAAGTCSDNTWTDEATCIVNGTCSNTWNTGGGWPWTNQTDCENGGYCSGNSNYHNNRSGCEYWGTCGNNAYNNNKAGCLQWGMCSDSQYNNQGEAMCLGASGWCTNGTYVTLESCENAGAQWNSNNSWSATYNWWPSYTWYQETWSLNTWSNSGYWWIIGSWSGNYNNVSLGEVENWLNGGGPSWSDNVNAIKISSMGSYRTYRASGYFKAPVTGTYTFEIKSDDASYMWMGANGQDMYYLVNWRDEQNYLCAAPGQHGDRIHFGQIYLTEGHIYPMLAYQENTQGPGSFELAMKIPSGAWNGNSGDEWKYVAPYVMPGDEIPTAIGDGQTVEGKWAATSVYAYYTD